MSETFARIRELSRIDAEAVTDIRIAEVRATTDHARPALAGRACPLPDVSHQIAEAQWCWRKRANRRCEEVTVAKRVRIGKYAVPRVGEAASFTLSFIAPWIAPHRSPTVARSVFPLVFARQPSSLTRADLICLGGIDLRRWIFVTRACVSVPMRCSDAHLIAHNEATALQFEVGAHTKPIDVEIRFNAGDRARCSIEEECTNVDPRAVSHKASGWHRNATCIRDELDRSGRRLDARAPCEGEYDECQTSERDQLTNRRVPSRLRHSLLRDVHRARAQSPR